MVWLFLESNSYALVERVFIGIIAIYIFFLFLLANKQISKDKNLTIDKMDKIIFFLAFTQIALLTVYFLIYTSTSLLACIRTCRLIQEVLLCMLLSYIIYEEIIQEIIFKIVTLCVISIVAFWFTIAILKNSRSDYDCKKTYWLIFSSITVFFSVSTVYFGFRALQLIQNFINNHKDILNEDFIEENGNKTIGKNLDELKNRKIQLFVIIVCSLVSSALQFTWDVIANQKATDSKNCLVYYMSNSFMTCVIFIFLKFLTLFLSAMSIYYTFYWRNKKNLDAKDEMDKNSNVFYDYRDKNNYEYENNKEFAHK